MAAREQEQLLKLRDEYTSLQMSLADARASVKKVIYRLIELDDSPSFHKAITTLDSIIDLQSQLFSKRTEAVCDLAVDRSVNL